MSLAAHPGRPSARRARRSTRLLVPWAVASTTLACEVGTIFLGSFHPATGDDSASSGGRGGATSSGGAHGEGGSEPGAPELLPLEPELLTGALRIVATTDRSTLGSTEAGLGFEPFRGDSEQMWLLRGDETSFVLEHEASGTCLGPEATLQECPTAPLVIRTWQTRSDARPGVFELSDGLDCLTVEAEGELSFGPCGTPAARFYLEPSGWGRRPAAAVEHTARLALLLKGVGSTQNPGLTLDIPTSNLAAVTQSFRECTGIWLASLTDGRVGFEAETFPSPRPIEAVETSCAHAVPAHGELEADYDEFIPQGGFDGVVVYWRPGSVDGGWSCGGAAGPRDAGLTFQAYGADEEGWLSCRPEPSGAFLQAYLAMAAPYYAGLGVPAPAGSIMGGADAGYAAGGFGWHHWRRDYLLGRVIREDGSYGGLGPRAFALGTLRSRAPQE